jgi:predicted hotdog family 3-hydroxylacyl-ACP dehydratase
MSALRRDAVLRLIPHAGEMCLIDEILAWDAGFLKCRSTRFAAPSNPLRRADGVLGMASGIEIAGQAMAAHGRLTAGVDTPAVPGMLVSLRDVTCAAGPLQGPELLIEVEQLMGDASGASYRFSITRAGEMLLGGRAIVVFAGAE